MSKVLYILGAGASAGTASSYGNETRLTEKLHNTPIIPTVYAMKERLQVLLDNYGQFSIPSKKINGYSPDILSEEYSKLKDDLIWFQKMLHREPYVDILAETLFKTRVRDFERLCRVLSAYIELEQGTNGVDLRYKSFITTIANLSRNTTLLPDSIKIFSYNYDYQFEEALVEKRGIGDRDLMYSELNSMVLNRNEILSEGADYSGFKLLKLNGSASAVIGPDEDKCIKYTTRLIGESNIYLSDINGIQESSRKSFLIAQVLSQLLFYKDRNIRPSLKFAWDDSSEGLVQKIEKMSWLQEIRSVVVIGYSFPALNFKIDKAIFSSLNCNNILIQCRPDDFDAIKARFEFLRQPNQHLVYHLGVDEFAVPYNVL